MFSFNLKLGSSLLREKYHTESYGVLFSALKLGAISLEFIDMFIYVFNLLW